MEAACRNICFTSTLNGRLSTAALINIFIVKNAALINIFIVKNAALV